MLKILTGIFYLFILVILAFVMIKLISRRMKNTFKPRKSKVSYAVEIDPRTAAPQLLNQILLMLPGESNEVLSRMCILANDGNQAEIDVLLICPTGLYLFNSINESGYVTGSEEDRQWFVLQEDGNRKAFKNPLEENRYSIQALLTRYPEIKEEWIHDYVVFSNRCGIRALQVEAASTIVLNRKKLFERLRGQIAEQPVVLTPERIQYLYNRLKLYTDGKNMPSDSNRRKTGRQPFSPKTAMEIHEVKAPDLTQFSPEDQCLKNKLMIFAKDQSRRDGVDVAQVLDRTRIENLVNMKPQNRIELETVQGMDEKRCEKYGERIVQIIEQHYRETIDKY
ncbi:NERD domain-containing protein [Eubacterium sp. 1001713B170207_170306_E7]|uniref:NERD domain-containing protein n=1 Tax=Eubacterium sp. 1001713B170207_170306_E7 TaxID=2787097 RepID=UPI00189845FE|nr:NERD domain-containing protein [Eubacterium sp. 1001713B170207_170306_E7]